MYFSVKLPNNYLKILVLEYFPPFFQPAVMGDGAKLEDLDKDSSTVSEKSLSSAINLETHTFKFF